MKALALLGLPIVIKENYSNGGNAVWICEDTLSFNALIANYSFQEPLFAEQFIDGDQIGVEALFKHGELLHYVCARNIESGIGPSTKRRYFPNNETLTNLIQKFGRSTLLHGFVNMTLMQAASDQQYYLFEADPRPNKWVAYGRWFGCDFSIGIKEWLRDEVSSGMLENDGMEFPKDCEVEYFPNYAAKLINQGRTKEAILHLLDFKRNYRYTLYDPVLLEDKLACIRDGLHFLS